MTSRNKWPLVLTLFFILSLFLAACERPLPDDGSADVPAQEAPAPGSYPGPSGEESSDPGQPAPLPDDGGSGYPGPDAGPDQPAEEAAPDEAYPAAEDEESSEESVEAVQPEDTPAETQEEVPAEESAAGESAAEGDESAGTEAAPEESQTPETDEQSGERVHVVAAGENLYQIGLQYGISWVAIAQANGIVNPDSLSVGQELIIPDLSESAAPAETVEEETPESSEAVEEPAAEETVQSAAAEETEAAEEESAQTVYVVQSGDNLYRISLMFGVNMMDVARANDLANFDDLSVGQELIIPGVEPTETEESESGEAPAAPSAEEISHQVAEGETVFGIAFQYGIAWTNLVERNNLTSPYTLEPGQTLVIPASE